MPPPRLLLRFEEPVAFATEYERNMSTGGAFVPTDTIFDAREIVELEVHLAWRPESFVEAAEVVYCGPGPDGRPGIAVQLLCEIATLREKLQVFVADAADAEDRRRRRRHDARIPVRLNAGDVHLESHSRDLSETGILVSGDGSDMPIGQKVQLELTDPTSGEHLQLEGAVARQVESEGTVAAIGIQFDEPLGGEETMQSFVERVGSADIRRSGTGLAGNIQELGLPNLVQMLGASCERGTLVIQRGPEEGEIAFDSGILLRARLGGVLGMKALMRMLGWEAGRFRFYAEIETSEGDTPMPLDAALFEGTRLLDEARRQPTLAPTTVLSVEIGAAAAADDLSKTEDAVLELAGAGMTVRRILDIIPDEDAEVLAAIHTLVERGLVTPDPE
jgi:Tfp pilus assembly protein PilZ